MQKALPTSLAVVFPLLIAGYSEGKTANQTRARPQAEAAPERAAATNAPAGHAPKGYRLVWSDEFDSQEQFLSNWSFERGGTGWGNGELQYYCAGGVYGPTGQKTASVVGGSWGGTPAEDFGEATYEIDWVRVYQRPDRTDLR